MYQHKVTYFVLVVYLYCPFLIIAGNSNLYYAINFPVHHGISMFKMSNMPDYCIYPYLVFNFLFNINLVHLLGAVHYYSLLFFIHFYLYMYIL